MMSSVITPPLAFAFGGPADWIILFVVALVVLGPSKLPEVGQQLGKALREFRKIADEVTGATRSVHEEITAATTKFRSEVETTHRDVVSPVRYDQRNEDLMAPAPRLTLSTSGDESTARSVEPKPGLRLSTNPDKAPADEPEGQ